MRLGIELIGQSRGDLLVQAELADKLGLDHCHVPESLDQGRARSSTVVACSLARVTRSIRLNVELGTGTHPVDLAEEIAVSDLLLRGRVTPVLNHLSGGQLSDTMTVLRQALRGLPIQHEASLRTIPHPGASHAPQQVTPLPAQPDIPVWVLASADDAPLVLSAGGTWLMPHSCTSEVGHRRWEDLAEECAALAASSYRPALRRLGSHGLPKLASRDDAADLAARLIEERDRWGMVSCTLRFADSASVKDRLRGIRLLAERVRPRLVGSPPPELVSWWDELEETTSC